MAYRKLNRASGNRKALFRSLSSALIMNGRIETTITKAKETSKNVAKLITPRRGDAAEMAIIELL